MTALALHHGEALALAVAAGGTIDIERLQAQAGAAVFAWARHDPFEQISDAYTFMELRKTRPRAGDALFSTLRRRLVAILDDDEAAAIDLLRHDAWLAHAVARDRALAALATHSLSAADAKDWPAPDAKDWPAAINLFAATRVEPDGSLVAEPPSPGTRIVLRAMADLVVILVAGAATTDRAAITVTSALP